MPVYKQQAATFDQISSEGGGVVSVAVFVGGAEAELAPRFRPPI